MESALATLPSPELIDRLNVLVRRDRAAEAELLVYLGELDARRLYLEQGCSSTFDYCVRVLHFAEGVAYNRIHVARAARRHPELLVAIRRGDLHLSAARLLVPELTGDNARELVSAAKHKTSEQVRVLLADRQPRPDVPTSIRRLPEAEPRQPTRPTAMATPPAPEQSPAAVPAPAPTAQPQAAPRPEPLGGERYCVRFTADDETWSQLQELRSLMRHQIPDGDVGKILRRAVSSLLKEVRKQKLGACSKPTSQKPSVENPDPRGGGRRSRTVPRAIRREVFRRDRGRCTYVSPAGRRCGSRDFVELHHTKPWAKHHSHSAKDIVLRCRAHNLHQAERDFGARHMARFRSPRPRSPAGT